MKEFLTEDFLLETDTARELFHNHAEKMPIFDYHCHLPVKDIAENRLFENLTQIWLGGDHYKWRAMRANGVPEKYITGEADDWEKFKAWAGTVPCTVGNPLYHWTHLELKRYFGITDTRLDGDTARYIYDRCNELLNTEKFRVRKIMESMNVKGVCTTDDPVDTLAYHRFIRQDAGFPVGVFPTMRPDKAMAVENPALFSEWLSRLEEVCSSPVQSYDDFLACLHARHDFFQAAGCRLTDHAVESPPAEDFTDRAIRDIFARVRKGENVSRHEGLQFKTAVLLEFGRMNAAKGWTMQLHMGALRNVNSRMLNTIGPDTGFDSTGDFEIARPLGKFLNMLDRTNELPKMILYSLNSCDNEVVGTMIGNFQDGTIPGKMQFGSAWWFQDQKTGMEKQMTDLANYGLLSRFVGMLTDSRSFLSYPRHEYFRRVLCNLLGTWVEKGELPKDMQLLGTMVENISYNNAKNFFKD
ncbi:MAG: glucuronate isomerase [Spirochaetota bacterium]